MKESPLFVKTFDCLKWVMARTESFPKSQRFLLAKRINDAMFDFYERIGEAAVIKGTSELGRLREADARLKHLMQYLRLAMELKYLRSCFEMPVHSHPERSRRMTVMVSEVEPC